MPSVNMLQAKSSLSRLVEAIEQGQEREIVITRNGRPAAKLVSISTSTMPRSPTYSLVGMSLEPTTSFLAN